MGVALGSQGHAISIADFPDAIALEPPERRFCMDRLAVRTERPQQLGEHPVRFLVGGKALLTPDAPSDCPQCQERLVRCPLPVAAPNLEPQEALE